MRFPEDQERSKTLETSPPFLTFGSLTVPYFLSYSLIILSKARFIKSLIAIPSLATTMKQKGGFGHDNYRKNAPFFGRKSTIFAQTFGFGLYFG